MCGTLCSLMKTTSDPDEVTGSRSWMNFQWPERRPMSFLHELFIDFKMCALSFHTMVRLMYWFDILLLLNMWCWPARVAHIWCNGGCSLITPHNILFSLCILFFYLIVKYHLLLNQQSFPTPNMYEKLLSVRQFHQFGFHQRRIASFSLYIKEKTTTLVSVLPYDNQYCSNSSASTCMCVHVDSAQCVTMHCV